MLKNYVDENAILVKDIVINFPFFPIIIRLNLNQHGNLTCMIYSDMIIEKDHTNAFHTMVLISVGKFQLPVRWGQPKHMPDNL